MNNISTYQKMLLHGLRPSTLSCVGVGVSVWVWGGGGGGGAISNLRHDTLGSPCLHISESLIVLATDSFVLTLETI